MTEPIALDTDVLNRARALHRVWRALNDGDCPKCHAFRPATDMYRCHFDGDNVKIMDGIKCPSCGFHVTTSEVEEIEKLFAPAMDAAVAIFEEWRESRRAQQ